MTIPNYPTWHLLPPTKGGWAGTLPCLVTVVSLGHAGLYLFLTYYSTTVTEMEPRASSTVGKGCATEHAPHMFDTQQTKVLDVAGNGGVPDLPTCTPQPQA